MRWRIGSAALVLAVAAGCGGGSPATTSRPSRADVATTGIELYEERVVGGNPGCVTCHSLEAGVTLVGPSLDRVESPIPGLSVAEYVRQSIVAPDNYVVSGFAEGQMPGNWEVLLTPEQIESLVSLLANDG